jgi:hypothetical protein
MGAIAKVFQKKAQQIKDHLAALSPSAVLQLKQAVDAGQKYTVHGTNGESFELDSTLVGTKITKKMKDRTWLVLARSFSLGPPFPGGRAARGPVGGTSLTP